MIGTSSAESLSRVAGDEQLNRIQRTGDNTHQKEGRQQSKKRRRDDSEADDRNSDKVTLSVHQTAPHEGETSEYAKQNVIDQATGPGDDSNSDKPHHGVDITA